MPVTDFKLGVLLIQLPVALVSLDALGLGIGQPVESFPGLGLQLVEHLLVDVNVRPLGGFPGGIRGAGRVDGIGGVAGVLLHIICQSDAVDVAEHAGLVEDLGGGPELPQGDGPTGVGDALHLSRFTNLGRLCPVLALQVAPPRLAGHFRKLVQAVLVRLPLGHRVFYTLLLKGAVHLPKLEFVLGLRHVQPLAVERALGLTMHKLLRALTDGGGSSNGGGDTGGGAGGSGAATIRRTLPVDPGVTYPITIGTAGSGNSAGVAGLAGGNTAFGSLVQANGGNGGGSSTTSAAGVASTAGNGTMAGFGGGVTITFTTTAMPILYGFGAAISGSTGGNGGDGFTGDHGVAGNRLETFAGGARGLGDLGNKAGGGGGGSSAFGKGGNGGNYGGVAATVPAAGNYGAGGGGGAAMGVGANGSDGLCIVEWIS